MNIGLKIKITRKKANLTQKQLGEKIGVSEAAINQWERGVRRPKLDTLERIAAAVNCDLLHLLKDEEEPENHVIDRIKRILNQRNISIRQLAIRSSIPYNTAVSALNHRKTISAKQLFAFAKTLNVDVRELWYGEGFDCDNDKQNEEQEGGTMSSEFAVKVLKDMAEAAEAASNPDKQKAFEEEMELQKKRCEKADELSLQALCAMNTAMVAIEKVLAENEVTIDQLMGLTGKMAEIGMSMGQLRMNMGFGWSGMGCGYGA